jgi:hypothetical protein
MFHFPALPPHRLYIHRRVTRHHSRRVSPFGHPRIHARLTAPRGISQPPTSFIGSRCQGIHHAPLNTYKHKNQKQKLQHRQDHKPCLLDARNHYPQIKDHTPPPSVRGQHHNRRVASGPNSVPGEPAGRPPRGNPPVGVLVHCHNLHHRPPTTGAGKKYPNHDTPTLLWGMREHGAP